MTKPCKSTRQSQQPQPIRLEHIQQLSAAELEAQLSAALAQIKGRN